MKQYAIVTLTARPAEFTNSTYALSVRAAEVSFIFSTTKQISRNVHRKKTTLMNERRFLGLRIWPVV